MNPETNHGRCLCGAIRFEASGAAEWIAHCHCQSCRRNTGAAVATFVGFRPEQVVYTQGERKIYSSSPGVRRGFCADCGTPLTYEADKFPNETHLYISSFDQPENFPPTYHVFCEEKIDWFETADTLPRHPKGGEDNAS